MVYTNNVLLVLYSFVSEAEAQLKRAKWRSMERGTKENELIFRSFFVKHENDLKTDSALRDEYTKILDEVDPDLFSWLTKSMLSSFGLVYTLCSFYL